MSFSCKFLVCFYCDQRTHCIAFQLPYVLNFDLGPSMWSAEVLCGHSTNNVSSAMV